jgi:hypothetical protein
LKKNGNWTDE